MSGKSIKYDPDYKPRLYSGGWDINKVWYIDYRVWDTDQERFVRKQYKGMNKHRTLARRKAAALAALDDIKALIKAGAVTGQASTQQGRFDLRTLTVRQAYTYYLNNKNGTLAGNEEHTLVKKHSPKTAIVSKNTYKNNRTLMNLLVDYLQVAGEPRLLLKNFDVHWCSRFLDYLRIEKNYVARSVNNYKRDLSALFNYYISIQELPLKNPTLKLKDLNEQDSDKHPAYTTAQISQLVAKIKEKGDDQLLLFIECIYYLFVRPREELRLLRVGDIGQHTLLIQSGSAKNNKAEYVTIPHELQKRFSEKRIREYPPNYYVFTLKGQPGPKPVGVEYFYTRHRPYLQELSLDGYSMYGYKHTGAIELYKQTLDILLVSRHCRHQSTQQTETYLRAYGVMVESQVLHMPKFG